ncbi:MAG: HesA/MoeB/ThiF family protein [Chloroflexota bacterium]
MDSQLNAADRERYSRQLVIPQLGEAGQAKLAGASVLVVGLGGLGSPAALYLAAAGVGQIGLLDADRVELSNLQRQVLHGTPSIGRAKVDSARERLTDLNPAVRFREHRYRLTPANVRETIDEYDVVIDAVDNFATRYLLNDACYLAGIPLVEAGVLRFDGLATVVRPRTGPCYRCAFPRPPIAGTTPPPAQAGVIGPLPGMFGALQAMEAIKLVTGTGEPLYGKLVAYSGLTGRFEVIELAHDPACPLCGDQPTITSIDADNPDYER